MTNPEIRKRAWQLYRQDFKRFLLIGMVLVLIYAASVFLSVGIAFLEPTLDVEAPEYVQGPVTIYANRDSVRVVTAEVWGFVMAVIFWPIVGAGAMRVGWRAWSGQRPRLRDLFAFTHPARNLLKTLAIGLFVTLLNLKIIPLVALALTGDFSPKTGTGVQMLLADDGLSPLYAAVNMITTIVAIWTGLRMYLANYLPSDEPELSAWGMIARSWKTMRGACGDVIAMNLALCWVYLPIFVVNLTNFPAHINYVLIGLAALVGLLFGGYMITAYAGLAHEILHPAPEEQPKIEGAAAADGVPLPDRPRGAEEESPVN